MDSQDKALAAMFGMVAAGILFIVCGLSYATHEEERTRRACIHEHGRLVYGECVFSTEAEKGE